ncbi:hypothetical protein [Aquimarina agarilytica]|uniref:hypothetical protein n=1 Tax=Aquimarina agarilytica TaxID=1087449 RepID=UPI000288FF3B|nr:hypothetical protein [Aquimarina agarilytica]
MYKFFDKVKNIDDFFLIKSLVIVFSKDDINNFKDLVRIPLKEGKRRINPICIVSDDEIYFSDYESKPYVFSLKENNLKNFKEFDFENSFYNLCLGSVYDTNENANSILLDLRTEDVIYESEYDLKKSFISNEYVLGVVGLNATQFFFKKLKEPIEWVIDLKVLHVIGVFDEQIILHLPNFIIVGIDIYSGKELWRVNNIFGNLSLDEYEGCSLNKLRSLSWNFDGRRGCVFLFFNNYLLRLDLKKKEISVVRDFNDYENKEEWYFRESNLYYNKLTFIASKRLGAFSNYFGVIDLDTMEIICCQRSQSTAFYTKAPQLKEDKLYILDNNKTLYIFKKEVLQ